MSVDFKSYSGYERVHIDEVTMPLGRTDGYHQPYSRSAATNACLPRKRGRRRCKTWRRFFFYS
jgi:hypothetical protein